MLLADETIEWDSRIAASDEMPTQWYDQTGSTLKLKDLGGSFYQNVLLTPHTFRYELPRGIHPIKELLLREVTLCERDRRIVQLYKVAHGHDHYLGEWMVVKAQSVGRAHVILQRRSEQRDNGGAHDVADATRSRSEKRHAALLRSLFPAPFMIDFEPECASGLRVNCVEKGRANPWCSDFYTVDFVIADLTRSFYLAIESKASVEALDEVAKTKCRRLRDKGHRRVVAICGHEQSLSVYDFATRTEDEAWHTLDWLQTFSK